MVRLVLVLSLGLAACFRPVSRPPTIPLPDLPPDAFISVRTSRENATIDVQREVGTSCITGTSNCVTRYANGRENITVTATTMTARSPITAASSRAPRKRSRPASRS